MSTKEPPPQEFLPVFDNLLSFAHLLVLLPPLLPLQLGGKELKMEFSPAQATRYFKTLMDFWRLRPKKFFETRSVNASEYMAPLPFFISTLAIALAISFVLATALADEFSTSASELRVGTLRMLGILVASLVVSILLIRAISRVWPMRGRADFSSILDVNCYVQGSFLQYSGVFQRSQWQTT